MRVTFKKILQLDLYNLLNKSKIIFNLKWNVLLNL